MRVVKTIVTAIYHVLFEGTKLVTHQAELLAKLLDRLWDVEVGLLVALVELDLSANLAQLVCEGEAAWVSHGDASG